jgi:hypothetical protein
LIAELTRAGDYLAWLLRRISLGRNECVYDFYDTRLLASREISRFPRKERPHMPGSATTPGRLGTRDVAPIRVAFRQPNDVCTRQERSFAAQWLAYALPCQRFADTLASSRA